MADDGLTGICVDHPREARDGDCLPCAIDDALERAPDHVDLVGLGMLIHPSHYDG